MPDDDGLSTRGRCSRIAIAAIAIIAVIITINIIARNDGGSQSSTIATKRRAKPSGRRVSDGERTIAQSKPPASARTESMASNRKWSTQLAEIELESMLETDTLPVDELGQFTPNGLAAPPPRQNRRKRGRVAESAMACRLAELTHYTGGCVVESALCRYVWY